MSHHGRLISVKNAAPTVQMALPGCLEMNDFLSLDMLDNILRCKFDKSLAARKSKIRVIFRHLSTSQC